MSNPRTRVVTDKRGHEWEIMDDGYRLYGRPLGTDHALNLSREEWILVAAYKHCDVPSLADLVVDLVMAPAPMVPNACDGKEQEAFEAWAKSRGMDMTMTAHPFHYLFLMRREAARDGWRAAIDYVQRTICGTPTVVADDAQYKKGHDSAIEDVAKWHDQQADQCGEWRNWGGPSDPVAQQKEIFHRECAKNLRAGVIAATHAARSLVDGTSA
jgi:hypothetical protein